MVLWELFLSYLQIGMFSFGGGLAAMPLIKNQVVDVHHWMTMEQFSDLVTIAEMTPGPIAVNSATFVGIQVAGFLGAIVATIACILPAMVVVNILGYLYYKYRELTIIDGVLKGLRPAVVSLIASAGLSILILSFWGDQVPSLDSTQWLAVLIFAVALFILRKFKKDPIVVMIGCGAAGAIFHAISLAL